MGNRFGLHKHIIDTYAEDSKGRIHLISLKWQQVAGTAEQKIPPSRCISLIDLLQKNENYFRAHLVLGGPGLEVTRILLRVGSLKWGREFISQRNHMVNIMTLDGARAVRGGGESGVVVGGLGLQAFAEAKLSFHPACEGYFLAD